MIALPDQSMRFAMANDVEKRLAQPFGKSISSEV